MNKSAIGFAALAASFALAVSAQTPPPKSDIPASPDSTPTTDSVQFGTVDQNRDGRISRAEALSHGGQLGVAFTNLDADKDAYLSQAEFGKWSPARQIIDAADPVAPSDLAVPNGDGSSISRTPATGE